MTFQVLDFKENYFPDLLDNEYLPIKLTYTKDNITIDISRMQHGEGSRVITTQLAIPK